jgi:transposase
MSDDMADLARRLVVGHKRDGRSVYDEQAKTELVKACSKPGTRATASRSCCRGRSGAKWAEDAKDMPLAT